MYAPRSNIVQQYGTHGRNTSHTDLKWFKGQPQGMFKMTITTQAESQTCSKSLSCLLLSNAEIKPVSQCYTKYITNRSMSITVISQQHETINFLFPTQKQNTTWTHSFRGLYDFGMDYRLRLRMPQLTVPAFASGLNKFYAF